jgi:hypothetical protein
VDGAEFNVILVTHDLREAVFLADTVYVMSRSPGRMLVRREIELPRPRPLELTYSREFTDIVHELREHIGAIRQAADAERQRGDRAMTRRDKERWAPWLLLIATLLLWEGICTGFSVSEFIFPSPSRIASQLWEFRGTIAGHAWRTFWVTMVGFGLSIVVGTLLGFSSAARAPPMRRSIR